MSTPISTSNGNEPPQKIRNHRESSLSLSSLPTDIVVNCLARVPRSQYLHLSWLSKTLRSLVRSPELNQSRALRLKESLYVCFCDGETYHWFTLCLKTVEYELVPNPILFPSPPFKNDFTTHSIVAVGSEIYFAGGGDLIIRSPDLWILDTRSGELTQGPSMKVARCQPAVGVIDGKIYVLGGMGNRELRVEVYDPKSRIWKREAGKVSSQEIEPLSVSLERELYIVSTRRTRVYNPREGKTKQMVHIKNEALVVHSTGEGRKEEINAVLQCVCVVGNVLYACFGFDGIMWFDTTLKVWRGLVGRNGERVHAYLLSSHCTTMGVYDEKLAVFWCENKKDPKKSTVWCKVITLDRVGERVLGTIEWVGIVATVPRSYSFNTCLVVSH